MKYRNLILYQVILVALFVLSVQAVPAKRTVRIGYFEGGTYLMHKVVMGEIRHNLERMAGDSIDIVYVPNGYFSAEWDREICKTMSHDVVRNKSIDIVIAAGPWVIEDLLEAGFDKPIVGICQFDPFIQGLVDSTGRPKVKNLTVNYRPNKIKNDMAALERLFPSVKIGLLYFPSGDESEKLRDKVYAEAGKYGAVVHAGKEFSDRKLYTFFGSFSQIRGKVDVLYLPPMWGLELEQIRNFIWETQNAKIPTFTSEGLLLVEKDATASDCFRPYRAMGRFTADKIMKIISGKEPESLPTIFDDREELCINLESAAIVGAKVHRKDINDARVVAQLSGDTLTTYTLATATDQALRENAGYQARIQTYDRAVALAKSAYRDFYPTVDADLSAASTDEKVLATHYEEIFNHSWEAGINIEQKVLSFPALKAIEIAKKNISVEKNNVALAARDFRLVVALAYISILEKEEKLAACNESMDHLRLIRDDADANYRIGLTIHNDVPVADERFAAARIEMLNVQKELQISRIVFNTLINRPGSDNFVLDKKDFSPEIMAAIVSKLESYIADSPSEKKFENYLVEVGINNSMEMKQADLSMDMQRDLISAHKGERWPELSLMGRYSYGNGFDPALDGRRHYWVFGGIMRVPLFSAAGNSAKGHALRIEMDELQYRKDSLRFALMEKILSLKANIAGLLTALPLEYSNRNSAFAILDTVQSNYNDNGIPIYTVVDVEGNSSESALRSIEG